MNVTEPLRNDHQILRAKLTLLEAAMHMAPEVNFVLREMCWSLGKMLEAHIRHEVEAFRPYSNRIEALTQERMAEEHAEQQLTLRDVNTMLLRGIDAPVSKVVPSLSHLIEELREHMEQEEQEVFPMVDRIAEEKVQTPAPAPATPFITEEMSVNHVLRICPKAWKIFEAFHIDREADGLHCLDELHWRRGIDVAALLQALNRLGDESLVVD